MLLEVTKKIKLKRHHSNAVTLSLEGTKISNKDQSSQDMSALQTFYV